MAHKTFCRFPGVLAAVILAASGPHIIMGQKSMPDTMTTHKHTNKLINEASPYLLQHAHNPVDWYPWGQEALDRAMKQDKPIFLSIGYSTCHWCHVMERESFENERIAEIMNEHFVSIKVDREQRPDVDRVYMDAVQMMTGSGGWPLSVFLTPQGKPFYGGTYFPPTDMPGRPGFERVLLAIADAWKNKREQLISSAGKLSEALANVGPTQETKLSAAMMESGFNYLQRIFDPLRGGFGAAPKFPQPTYLSMLLGYGYRTGDKRALEMVEKTLDEMAKGGMYDHIGGGFHRYSTDARWLVPHFEKMLYDQALISRAYLEAWQITGKADYARVAREIFDYVLRDMTNPDGGFYSAEDADSEGHEGKFYVWDPKETTAVLGKNDAAIFNRYYGVTEKGNFEEGKSILNVTTPIEQLAKEYGKEQTEIESILAEARSKLFRARHKRIHPHTDDKVIAGWNGLMISSLAYGGAILGEEKYVKGAERCAEFILKTLHKDSRLMRYYRDGRVVERGFLDDHAYMILGLVSLYEASFDVKWLAEAKKLSSEMIDLFADEQRGGFFLTGKDSEKLIVRTRPNYDGAVPSGNSIAALALLRLGRLTMNQQLGVQGRKTLESFSQRLEQSPVSLSAMLVALNFWLGPAQEIVIAGADSAADTTGMLELVRRRFLPNTVVVLHDQGKTDAAFYEVLPFVRNQIARGDKATAYVCENYACKQPVNEIDEFEKMLSEIMRTK